jgi:hypothetical protein
MQAEFLHYLGQSSIVTDKGATKAAESGLFVCHLRIY